MVTFAAPVYKHFFTDSRYYRCQKCCKLTIFSPIFMLLAFTLYMWCDWNGEYKLLLYPQCKHLVILSIFPLSCLSSRVFSGCRWCHLPTADRETRIGSSQRAANSQDDECWFLLRGKCPLSKCCMCRESTTVGR